MRGRLRRWLGDDKLAPVEGGEALLRLFEASQAEPVVLFLHDPHCPVSALARIRLRKYSGQVHVVDVSRQHALSRRIEAFTGVRHESPQALVLRRGRPVWHASHGAISAEGIREAVEAARQDG